MRIPQLAIQNRHFTLVVIFICVTFGLYSFLSMPRAEDPQMAVPATSVTILYPGANPVDMERLVVDPIEEAIHELDDVKTISSVSGDGFADVSVEFEFSTDPDEKHQEVIEKVGGIRQDLPADLLKILYTQWEVGTVAILQLALISPTAPYATLERLAEDLEDRLEGIDGARDAQIHACPGQELQVGLDLERMARMGISLSQVAGAIRAANANIPGGSLAADGRKLSIRTSGLYKSLEEVESTVVGGRDGRIVYLSDIADVMFRDEEKDYHARFNGRRAVFVTLTQKDDTNIFDIVGQAKAEITELRADLPPSVELVVVFDQSRSVSDRFDLFLSNLLQGIFLVGLIILVGVGLRSAIVVMLAIPLSLFIGIGCVNLAGYALQQISIAGMVIVLGILVDNAIVVTENVSRFIRTGRSPEEASQAGTSQIGWAITSATATTVLAFLPLLTMQDKAGRFIRSLPVTVVFTLSASLVLALTLTPLLTSRLLKPGGEETESWMQRKLEAFIRRRYRPALRFCLSHTRLVLAAAVVLFLLAGLLFAFFVGVSFFPKAEKPQFLIDVNTPQGSSIEETDRAVLAVERELARREEIGHFASNIGRSNPRIYYNIIGETDKSSHGQIFVQLERYDQAEMQRLLSDLRGRFNGYPGARIEMKELEQGPPVEAPIAIKVLSRRIDVLENLSTEVENAFRAVPGVINVDNPLATSKTDLQVRINREKAGMLGLRLMDIDTAVRTAFSGWTISTFRDAYGRDYDIVLRMIQPVPGADARVSDFEKISVTSLAGAQVPLRQVASIEFTSGPVEIRHYNLERSVSITADVVAGTSVDEATSRIIDNLDRIDWPAGSRYHVSGELESRAESFGGMGIAVVIAVLAVFGVLVLQFRSFSQPFIILSSLPLAFVGSVLLLFATGYSFSFTAFIGLTSLVGIVVNDAIILVDFANQLIRRGEEPTAALMEAGQVRFLSIILTSATTIGGLLPLTLRGGTLWAPLGLTVIGGLFTSSLLTLFVVPVLYKVLARFSGAVRRAARPA